MRKNGKVGLNNRANLSLSNILQKAHQWARLRMWKHLGVSLHSTLFYMWKRGNSTTWGDSVEIHGYGCEEFGFHMEENDESLWYHHGGHLQCVIGYRDGVSNIIYFKAQEIAHDHRCEERHITKSLNEEVGLDDDKVDPKFGNLQHRRLDGVAYGWASVSRASRVWAHVPGGLGFRKWHASAVILTSVATIWATTMLEGRHKC